MNKRAVGKSRDCVNKGKAMTDSVTAETTPSGFSKADAESLGIRFYRDGEPSSPVFAAEKVCLYFEGDTLQQILGRIEDWHVTRLRMGLADPLPSVAVTTQGGTDAVAPA
jgi:hypothetical protein